MISKYNKEKKWEKTPSKMQMIDLVQGNTSELEHVDFCLRLSKCILSGTGKNTWKHNKILLNF